jgi:replicative DNA helicase
MPADQLVMRMLSSLGRIDQSRMRTGDMHDDDWPRFTSAVSLLKDKPLFIDDTPAITPNEVRTRARRVSRESGGLRLIVIDYLQLMRPNRGRQQPRLVGDLPDAQSHRAGNALSIDGVVAVEPGRREPQRQTTIDVGSQGKWRN